MDKLIITPKTKIYNLLEAYPELEEVLIATAPQFKKLTNPLLRKTITKITTISQAAIIASMNVETLVNTLREAAGQSGISLVDNEKITYNTVEPDWFSRDDISQTIDIRDMLSAGDQPVHEVLSSIKKLEEGAILEIIAPFLPAPLLDKAISMEYQHWIHEVESGEYRIYFKK